MLEIPLRVLVDRTNIINAGHPATDSVTQRKNNKVLCRDTVGMDFDLHSLISLFGMLCMFNLRKHRRAACLASVF